MCQQHFLETKNLSNTPHLHRKRFVSRLTNSKNVPRTFLSRTHTNSILNAIANRFVSGTRRSRNSKRTPSVIYSCHRGLHRCEVWVGNQGLLENTTQKALSRRPWGNCCLSCFRRFLHRRVISKRFHSSQQCVEIGAVFLLLTAVNLACFAENGL